MSRRLNSYSKRKIAAKKPSSSQNGAMSLHASHPSVHAGGIQEQSRGRGRAATCRRRKGRQNGRALSIETRRRSRSNNSRSAAATSCVLLLGCFYEREKARSSHVILVIKFCFSRARWFVAVCAIILFACLRGKGAEAQRAVIVCVLVLCV